MPILRKSKIQLGAEHQRLCQTASHFHQLVSSMCPSSIHKEGLGFRIQVFSKLMCWRNINLLDNSIKRELDELFSNSRSSRKKVFTAFLDQGLIEKVEYGKYRVTEKGERLWNALHSFNEIVSGEKPAVFSNKKPYYEHVFFKIKVDGESFCRIWHNWCLRNPTNKPLTHAFYDVTSDTPLQNTFRLKLSDNIKSHDMLVDDSTKKHFRVNFRKPLKKGNYIDFWYEYDWPEMLKNVYKQWDYCIDTKAYPIKFFTFFIELPLNHKIIEKSISLDVVGKKSLTKDFLCLQPIVYDSGGKRFLYWRMQNIPGGLKFNLSWEHN